MELEKPKPVGRVAEPGSAADPGAQAGGEGLPTLEHLGSVEDLEEIPAFLLPERPTPAAERAIKHGRYSCAYCGVGDSAQVDIKPAARTLPVSGPEHGEGELKIERLGRSYTYKVLLDDCGRLEAQTEEPLVPPGGVISGSLLVGGESRTIVAREVSRKSRSQTFALFAGALTITEKVVQNSGPTPGCVKLRISLGQQRTVFPIHIAPSVLDSATGRRRSIGYAEAIGRLADLLLAHRPPHGRTLIYACGQVDYFTIFSFQEVFRLLGVRSLAGNAEHCLNAGAVHNQMLTGQEGPFLTIDQGLDGPNRFYLLNGWNGLTTHPPAFGKLLKRKDLDAYLVEVMVTESAKALMQKLGPDRVLLIKSGSDPHLALAVAHEILTRHEQAIETRFLDQYSNRETFERYAALARSADFAPERVAERIAPEPACAGAILRGIRDIAARLAKPEVVPINIPSVGLSQSKGAVSHCLWGSLLGMLGKYGLRADSTPSGGTLRLPGQINAQTEVQGLGSNMFMGRIRCTPEGAVDAARRMALPDDAYDMAMADTPRPALDYSQETPGVRELFICFGTQFESNMLGRTRWMKKLEDPTTTLVVVDPVPDPFTLRKAALVVPSPPHAAAPKLYQNGEWRLTLSVPRKRAAPETRSDPTIVYDAMAEISRMLRGDPRLRASHPDLARHVESGYLRERFESPERGGGLRRIEGEVSRPQLWARVQSYMAGRADCLGPLYCRPEHADGWPISWEELLKEGNLIYGGVGTTRYRLDYSNPEHVPFRDLYRRPYRFHFFLPTEEDLRIPEGIIMNSGRSPMSDDKTRLRFAMSTFNSGKATGAVDMPDENPLYISLAMAERLGVKEGDRVRIANPETGGAITVPVVATDRVKGQTVYINFHKTRAEVTEQRYLNALTSHAGRCPYTNQSNFKVTQVVLERVAAAKLEAGNENTAPIAAAASASSLLMERGT